MIVCGRIAFEEKTSKIESFDISAFQTNCLEIVKLVCEVPQGMPSRKTEKDFGRVILEEIKGVTHIIPGGAHAPSVDGFMWKSLWVGGLGARGLGNFLALEGWRFCDGGFAGVVGGFCEFLPSGLEDSFFLGGWGLEGLGFGLAKMSIGMEVSMSTCLSSRSVGT